MRLYSRQYVFILPLYILGLLGVSSLENSLAIQSDLMKSLTPQARSKQCMIGPALTKLSAGDLGAG